MELKKLLQIFKKNWFWLVVPLILVPALALTFIKVKAPQPTANFSLTFVPSNQGQTNSNLNVIQLANLLAGTAQSWLKDPALVAQILNNAGINPKDYSNTDLTKLFTITLRDNSFALSVQVEGNSDVQATNLANSAIDLVKSKTAEFDQNSQNGIQFAAQASTPYISQEKTDPMITLLLGVLAGLAIGLILALSKHYVEN